jgi:hypothetical protein
MFTIAKEEINYSKHLGLHATGLLHLFPNQNPFQSDMLN